MGDIADRLMEGCLCFTHLHNVIHAVRKCVRWNLLCKQKQMAAEMSLSTWSMSHILHDNLRLGAYRHCIGPTLTLRPKEIAGLAELLFYNDSRGRNIETSSLQTIRFFLLRKNWIVRMTECMYGATTKPESRCHRSHACPSPPVMVVWDLSCHGTTQIHFCKQGVKTDKKVYQVMLEEIVEPLQDTFSPCS